MLKALNKSLARRSYRKTLSSHLWFQTNCLEIPICLTLYADDSSYLLLSIITQTFITLITKSTQSNSKINDITFYFHFQLKLNERRLSFSDCLTNARVKSNC